MSEERNLPILYSKDGKWCCEIFHPGGYIIQAFGKNVDEAYFEFIGALVSDFVKRHPERIREIMQETGCDEYTS